MSIERGIMMANSRISLYINEEVKQNAQQLFEELGLDLADAIELFLRTAIVQGRIPFEISAEQAFWECTQSGYINAMLEESMREANDPNTKWISQLEMKKRLAVRREARHHVCAWTH